MFNISKHIYLHFEFFAVAGTSEPDFVLSHDELDAIGKFVAEVDTEIIGLTVHGQSWSMCDITHVPSLCYKVDLTVAEPVVKTPPRRNFYRDALHIQGGACNPRAIVNTIKDFMTGPLSERDTDSLRANPGLRLMVHQLAHLMGVHELESRPLVYTEVTQACETLANGEAFPIGQHYWHGVNGDWAGLLLEQRNKLTKFLSRYPTGQKFKILMPQYDLCAVDDQKCSCFVVCPYTGDES